MSGSLEAALALFALPGGTTLSIRIELPKRIPVLIQVAVPGPA